MKIEVTQTMIDEGEACSCSGCPVAKGIIQATGIEGVRVECHQASSVASFSDIRVRIAGKLKTLPDPALAFIDAFDSGKPVRPFSFGLAYP